MMRTLNLLLLDARSINLARFTFLDPAIYFYGINRIGSMRDHRNLSKFRLAAVRQAMRTVEPVIEGTAFIEIANENQWLEFQCLRHHARRVEGWVPSQQCTQSGRLMTVNVRSSSSSCRHDHRHFKSSWFAAINHPPQPTPHQWKRLVPGDTSLWGESQESPSQHTGWTSSALLKN